MKLLYIVSSKQTGKIPLWLRIQIRVIFITNSICTSVEILLRISTEVLHYSAWTAHLPNNRTKRRKIDGSFWFRLHGAIFRHLSQKCFEIERVTHRKDWPEHQLSFWVKGKLSWKKTNWTCHTTWHTQFGCQLVFLWKKTSWKNPELNIKFVFLVKKKWI